MTDPTVITLLDVVRVADEVTAERPERKNPWYVNEAAEMACLYTDHDDSSSHCLGGEILLRLGCELPDEGESVMTTPGKLRFAGYLNEYEIGAAMKFLVYLQGEADGGKTHDDSGEELDDFRMEWREAFENARFYYQLAVDAAEDAG